MLATTLTNAFSFTLAGVLGLIAFGEQMSPQWCIGTIVILLGVYLVTSGSKESKPFEEGTMRELLQKPTTNKRLRRSARLRGKCE